MPSSLIEDYFDSSPPEFLDDAYAYYSPPCSNDEVIFDDNFQIDDEELNQWFAPSAEKWNDWLSSDHAANISMDSAKSLQWDLAQDELRQIKTSFCEYILENGDGTSNVASSHDAKNVGLEDITNVIIGPQSVSGQFLMKELDLTETEYLNFLCTFCIQAAYGVSVSQLYNKDSILKEETMMPEDEYVQIWKKMATKRSLDDSEMSTSRRKLPIWQRFQTKVNDVLSEISIAGRSGKISIALDDDKIWLNQANAAKKDQFNLRFTRHTKPNRNGIIAHTAVTSGAMFPLGIEFERAKDTTISCFKRLINTLFGQGGCEPNLRNVHIHSDRGYMLPILVFEYLLAAGAEIVGTIKRLTFCWPFTYKQHLREGDKQTMIDLKGAPTLFLKFCKSSGSRVKTLFASAFRNGTDSAAMAISTLHNHHQWEGVILEPQQLLQYNRDKTALETDFFKWVELKYDQGSYHVNDSFGEEEDDYDYLYPSEPSFFVMEAIKYIRQNVIDMCTLLQGTFTCSCTAH